MAPPPTTSAPGRSSNTVATRLRRNASLLNIRVVVSLWTIQQATVLFVAASLFAFICLGDGYISTAKISDIDNGTPVSNSSIFLAAASIPLNLFYLAWEARTFLKGRLRPYTYLVMQVIKLQTGIMWILLWKDLTNGSSREWKWILWRAGATVLLPFIMSLAYAVIVYRRSKREERSLSKTTANYEVVGLADRDSGQSVEEDEEVPYDHNGN